LTTGKTSGEMKQLSKNGERWRHFVYAPCSSGSDDDDIQSLQCSTRIYITAQHCNSVYLYAI
jgi:hypothetical protein